MTAPVPDEAGPLTQALEIKAYNAGAVGNWKDVPMLEARAALLAYIAGVAKERFELDGTVRLLGKVQTDLIAERDRLRAELQKARKSTERWRGCPCKIIEPCHSSCSCANGFLSGGCYRCATHGSDEQRKAAAEAIAKAIDAALAGTREATETVPPAPPAS